MKLVVYHRIVGLCIKRLKRNYLVDCECWKNLSYHHKNGTRWDSKLTVMGSGDGEFPVKIENIHQQVELKNPLPFIFISALKMIEFPGVTMSRLLEIVPGLDKISPQLLDRLRVEGMYFQPVVFFNDMV